MGKLYGQEVWAIIPARGSSKRLQKKNIATLGGFPLLHWTVEAAQEASYVDRIIVTTDDPEVATVARSIGAEVIMRPEELCAYETCLRDVVNHAMAATVGKPTIRVTMYPTSPFRPDGLVDECIMLSKYHGKALTYANGKPLGSVISTHFETLERLSKQFHARHPITMGSPWDVDIDTPEDLAEAERLVPYVSKM